MPIVSHGKVVHGGADELSFYIQKALLCSELTSIQQWGGNYNPRANKIALRCLLPRSTFCLPSTPHAPNTPSASLSNPHVPDANVTARSHSDLLHLSPMNLSLHFTHIQLSLHMFAYKCIECCLGELCLWAVQQPEISFLVICNASLAFVLKVSLVPCSVLDRDLSSLSLCLALF